MVFDLCSLLLLFSVAKRFFEVKTAFLATALYAVLEFPIYFAQEGRMYSLLAMQCLLVLRLLLPLSELTIAKSILLTIVSTCGLYTHYYFAFFILGVGLALLFDFRSKGFSRALTALIISGLGFVPWISVVLKLAADGGQIFREFSIVSIPYSIFRFLAGYAVFPLDSVAKADPLAAVEGSLLFILAYGLMSLLLLFLGLYSLRKTKSYLYFLFPLLTSALIPLLISTKIPMFSERYLSGVIPLVCILFALAIESLIGTTKKMAMASLTFCLTYALFAHYGGEPRFKKEQWREVVELLRKEKRTEQVYIESDVIRPILNFYCPECIIKNTASLPNQEPPVGSALVTRGKLGTVHNSSIVKIFPAESGLYVSYLKSKPKS